MAYIEMIDSCKSYKMGETQILANNKVSFEVEKGELAIILGTSGAVSYTHLTLPTN